VLKQGTSLPSPPLRRRLSHPSARRRKIIILYSTAGGCSERGGKKEKGGIFGKHLETARSGPARRAERTSKASLRRRRREAPLRSTRSSSFPLFVCSFGEAERRFRAPEVGILSAPAAVLASSRLGEGEPWISPAWGASVLPVFLFSSCDLLWGFAKFRVFFKGCWWVSALWLWVPVAA